MTAKTDAAPEDRVRFRFLPDPAGGWGGPPFWQQVFTSQEGDAQYLLATPEALARQPEIQALIAAAVKAEREAILAFSDEEFGISAAAGLKAFIRNRSQS